jgi:hypothetical protein
MMCSPPGDITTPSLPIWALLHTIKLGNLREYKTTKIRIQDLYQQAKRLARSVFVLENNEKCICDDYLMNKYLFQIFSKIDKANPPPK